MEFKIEKKKNSVDIPFRKGIYLEAPINKALKEIGKSLKIKKRSENENFIVNLKPPEKTDLEELAWQFCNLVIASYKEGV